MSRDKDPTECGEFTVKLATNDALLVVDADDNEYWIPKSQIDPDGGIDAESGPGDEGELILPEWLAVERGLV
jgi:hypothetical protein